MTNANQRDRLEDRLKSLDSRLKEEDENQKADKTKSDNANFANAIRLSTEFVVAILVGAGLGWTIDKYFGTAPWAMIILLPLGFVAGVKNIMRAAGLQARADSGKTGQDVVDHPKD